MSSLDALWKLLRTAVGVFWDLLTFFRLTFRTPQAVAAENLFLREQLALYVERKTKPHRATDAVRFTTAQLSRFFEWRVNGLCSSFGNVSREKNRTSSSFMTATASIPGDWIRHFDRCV